MVDGGGHVIVPAQEVLEVQHKHRCGQAGKISLVFTECNNPYKFWDYT